MRLSKILKCSVLPRKCNNRFPVTVYGSAGVKLQIIMRFREKFVGFVHDAKSSPDTFQCISRVGLRGWRREAATNALWGAGAGAETKGKLFFEKLALKLVPRLFCFLDECKRTLHRCALPPTITLFFPISRQSNEDVRKGRGNKCKWVNFVSADFVCMSVRKCSRLTEKLCVQSSSNPVSAYLNLRNITCCIMLLTLVEFAPGISFIQNIVITQRDL